MQAHCNVNSSEGFAGESLAGRLRLGVGDAGRDLPARLRDSVATGCPWVVDDVASIDTIHEVVLDIPNALVRVAEVAAKSVLCWEPNGGDPTPVLHRFRRKKNILA